MFDWFISYCPVVNYLISHFDQPLCVCWNLVLLPFKSAVTSCVKKQRSNINKRKKKTELKPRRVLSRALTWIIYFTYLNVIVVFLFVFYCDSYFTLQRYFFLPFYNDVNDPCSSSSVWTFIYFLYLQQWSMEAQSCHCFIDQSSCWKNKQLRFLSFFYFNVFLLPQSFFFVINKSKKLKCHTS